MLLITSGFVANKLISADNIDEVSDSKMIEEDSNKESEMKFFISGANLAFAMLR